jgi:hypothetical protein
MVVNLLTKPVHNIGPLSTLMKNFRAIRIKTAQRLDWHHVKCVGLDYIFNQPWENVHPKGISVQFRELTEDQLEEFVNFLARSADDPKLFVAAARMSNYWRYHKDKKRIGKEWD